MEKLIPQANDLGKVIKVFLYVGIKEDSNLEDIAQYLQFEVRQASYYLNACYYLGLVDAKGKLSELGRSILDREDVYTAVYEVIITHPLISKIFAKLVLYPELTKDRVQKYAYSLVNKAEPNYSESVKIRRANCLTGWCIEIKKNCNIR